MADSADIVLLSCLFLLLVIAAEHAARRWAVPAPAWMLVLGLCYGLTGRLGWVIGKQLVRSGTSVGANYRAVCQGRSRADFISKAQP